MPDNKYFLVSEIVMPKEAHNMDQHFTREELNDALHSSGHWKSPGWDGLLVEFFKSFWNDKEVLLYMINVAWDNGVLLSLWKEGLVC